MTRRLALALVPTLALLPCAAGANLLANPGFDADLSSWTASVTSASWDALDVNGSGSSGSARLEGQGLLRQCVPSISGTSYSGGAWAYVPSGQDPLVGIVDMTLTFFPSADCSGLPFNTFMGVSLQPDPDEWGFLPVSGEIPNGAMSASFGMQILNTNGAFVAHFDDATFDVVPEPGRLLLLGAAAWLARRRARRA